MLCFYCLRILSSDIFFARKHIQQVKQSFVIFHINVVENMHEQTLCQYFGDITIACQQAAEIDLGQGKWLRSQLPQLWQKCVKCDMYLFVTLILLEFCNFLQNFFRHYKLIFKLKHQRAKSQSGESCGVRLAQYWKVFKEVSVLRSLWNYTLTYMCNQLISSLGGFFFFIFLNNDSSKLKEWTWHSSLRLRS